MIILLTGDNSYEIDQELGRIVNDFEGEIERIDTDTLEPRNLTDIFGGLSLFAANRLVVLKRVSENTAVWEALATWADKDSDTTVVLVEPKVDKRTKTYKALASQADVRTYVAFGDRDTPKVEQWLAGEAARRNIRIDDVAIREIIRRRGVEQYQLINTLEQLAVLGDVTRDVVDTHIEATPQENVFELLNASLSGDSSKVRSMVQTLRLTNDPYMTVGLLASQVFALSGLVLGGNSQSIASDLGVSPYVLRNLSGAADSIDKVKLKKLISALADADIGLKSSTVDPWLQIEIALSNK